MSSKSAWKRGMSVALLVSAVTFGTAIWPAHVAVAQTQNGQDSQIQADVMKGLDKKQFSNVKADVQGGVVVLTGTVGTYADKEDADRKTHHRKNVHGVQNLIQVAGAEIDDTTLRNKLAERLAGDRIGYGTTAFNAITIGVQNGVVTLGGVAYGPQDKDSAVSLVSHSAGVKDVVDDIEVAPLSPNDDGIRIAEARSIYGFGPLTKYGADPFKPIRITVINGNVTLSGVVDTQADKNMANIRANTVPGVFKVTNLLQVAGRNGERK